MRSLSFSIVIIFLLSCNETTYTWHKLEVTATAYNSLKSQTDNDPNITAFGDSLVPGKKYIAVSRDLLAMGIKHNTMVTIEGLDGIYLVKDKMNKRWKKRIDVYMGNDVKAARNWGRKKVTIRYRVKQ